jgi:hypothetical protein
LIFFLFSRDPSTRIFGFCFLGTLVVVTLGVIVGIAAGNIAHYSKNDFFDN